MEPFIIDYTVTNRITGKSKNYKTRTAANKAMDKADNAYGAVITTCKANWSDGK